MRMDEQNDGNRQRPEKKQLAFCQEYVKDFNGTRAADRAGYTGDDATLAATASRLLKSDKVAAEIAAILQVRCMTVDEALMRLAEQGRGAHSKYIKEDGTIDTENLVKDDNAHLIKKLKYKDGELVDIEFYDSQSALNLILRAQGAYQDNVDVTSGGDTIHVAIGGIDPKKLWQK